MAHSLDFNSERLLRAAREIQPDPSAPRGEDVEHVHSVQLVHGLAGTRCALGDRFLPPYYPEPTPSAPRPPRPRWSRLPPIMLVLHPNSRCDVCLEGYHGSREPVAINCGHIFCQWCLPSLPKSICPLCRHTFNPADVRRLHVDKTALPPCTPAFTSVELDALAAHAHRLQAAITRVALEGAPRPELEGLLCEVHDWLITQPEDQFTDLRAARLLLNKVNRTRTKLEKEKARVEEVEQTCSDLKAQYSDLQAQLDNERDDFERQLDEERDIAAAKYDELERRCFDERESLLAIEKALKEDKECLEKECDEWKSKFDAVSAECRRLTDDLERVKRNPPLSRPAESRHNYLHDRPRGDAVAVPKDEGKESGVAVKAQAVGTNNMFHLSPIPPTQPIPEMPSSMMAFLPLTDDDDLIDDDKPQATAPISSTSRSIPIMSRSDSHRMRSNSSLLSRPDPDAMSISVPRSTLDVHMASCSTSPSSAAVHYGPRSGEPGSGSYPRVPDNMLGLRAEPPRVSPSAVDSELKEQEERRERLAQLRDVLHDPIQAPSSNSPRKVSMSDGLERARPAVPSVMSSTRTPSPASSTSHSSYASSMEKEHGVSFKHQLLAAPAAKLSVASTAAAERERARASSVNSQNAPSVLPTSPPYGALHHPASSAISSTSLSHVMATRDRETATPSYPIYGPAPQPMSTQHQSRPPQTRRQSTDTTSTMSNLSSGSLSRGKASSMGIVPPGPYPSGLTRSMRAFQEPTRVS